MRTYYVYIITNAHKTVLYTGVTNNLHQRLIEHYLSSGKKSFTGRYNVHFLLHVECFASIKKAIAREKEIKGWRREKKVALINETNPAWKFLNEDYFGVWPPGEPVFSR